ncbi:MAG: putative transrane protein [Bacteroidetes bacterium]|nr:putative transrane protein [Bacteroidota bacterium]
MRNRDFYGRRKHEKNGALRGVIILLVGVFLLLHNLDLDIPEWIVSWQMLIMGIGLMIWIKSELRNVGGLIMMLIGSIFLIREYFYLPFDVDRFLWPGLLIIIGLLFIVFRPGSHKKYLDEDDEPKVVPDLYPEDEDYINADVVFSGENRLIVSKKFKGGRISAVFGGCDVNLLQADFDGTIVLNCDCVFGGVELVVPANWEVKIMTSSVFGGVEDKRPIELIGANPNKVLIIKGSCVFGGIEIKSYS